MIKYFCDMCKTEITRNYISDRYRPWVYANGKNFKADISIRQNGNPDSGEICRHCVKKIVAEGKEV
jgi:hypothetical protein